MAHARYRLTAKCACSPSQSRGSDGASAPWRRAGAGSVAGAGRWRTRSIPSATPAPPRPPFPASSPDRPDLGQSWMAARLDDPACHSDQDAGGIYYFDEPLARGKLAFVFPGEGAQRQRWAISAVISRPCAAVSTPWIGAVRPSARLPAQRNRVSAAGIFRSRPRRCGTPLQADGRRRRGRGRRQPGYLYARAARDRPRRGPRHSSGESSAMRGRHGRRGAQRSTGRRAKRSARTSRDGGRSAARRPSHRGGKARERVEALCASWRDSVRGRDTAAIRSS